MKPPSCIKAIRKGQLKKVESALKGGLSPDMFIGEALEWGWPKEEMGPTLLYLAAISEHAEELVPAMLEAGASADKEWVYESDWDPDDCYMSTSEVTVAKAAGAYASGEKDYFKAFYGDDNPKWTGNVQLRKLGYFNKDGEAQYGPPSAKVVAMLEAALPDDAS